MIAIDYKGHPKKPFRELIRTYSKTCLVLEDVLMNDDTYSYIYQDMLDMLKYGLEYKLVREFPIRFVIHSDEPRNADTAYMLECRHFLSNMVVWYAYMKMERVDILDESFIIDWRNKDIKFFERYANEKIIPYHSGDYHSMCAIIDEIVYHMKAISDAFCLIFGYSASIWDIAQAEKNDPEIHDILYGEIDHSLPPHEMEEYFRGINRKLMDKFASADSDLRPLLKSGKNISEDQFREIFLCAGFKADLSNRTIPWFIKENLLITGIDTPAAFYIYAEAGRRALITGKLSMSKPGAQSKRMNHNSTTAVLRKDNETCNSTRPVYYTIEDDDFLRMLDRRYYYDENGGLRELKYERDKHLIGKRLGFRSPCTCTSKEGVCRACYGSLFDMNSDLFSQGSLAATMSTEPVSQLILKVKHVNSTSSDQLEFSPGFDENFDIVSTEITASEDIDPDLLIALGPVKIEESDDGDEYYVEYFDVITFEGEVKAHIQEMHEYPLYLSDAMILAWKQMKDKPIPFARFDDEDDSTVLFKVEVKSKAVTQSLQLITQALDSKDHLGCTYDLDGLCQKYGRIMIDAGIMYNFVHGEMIIRQLLRKKNNEFEFPDFGPNGDHNDYMAMRLTTSLSKNPSPIVRLSTGWLKRSLISTALYKADAPSHLDPFFVPVLADVIDDDA